MHAGCQYRTFTVFLCILEGNKKYVKVVKPYKGDNSEELSLEVGDLIQALETKVTLCNLHEYLGHVGYAMQNSQMYQTTHQ